MHDLWVGLSEILRSLLDTHPLVVVGTVLFFEELGVPSPLPGDVLMMLAGVRARQGVAPLWAVLLVQDLATLAGTFGLFLFSRRFGRSLVTRYGWLLHLGPEQLARAEAAIRRSGGAAIVIGRLLPGLRIATPIAAAVLGTPPHTFVPAIALGAFLYLLAGVVALLATNGVVGVLVFILRLLGMPTPVPAIEAGTGLRLLLGWPLFLALASLLGAFDEQLGAERLPPVPRLALTAGVPLALTLLIAVPLAQSNLVPLAVRSGQILIAVEALRWLAFGVALGQLLPLDAKLHQLDA